MKPFGILLCVLLIVAGCHSTASRSDGDGDTDIDADTDVDADTDGDSECVPDCAGRTCGDDGCGNDCGSCRSGETCTPAGNCELLPEDCRVDGPCPGGYYCSLADGVCLEGCMADESCPQPGYCDAASHECSCDEGTHLCRDVCLSDDSPDSCGTSCAPCPELSNSTATCDGEQCGTRCNDGYHLCDGACVEDDSVDHCGDSCAPCTAPDNGVATCDGRSCGFECVADFHRCGESCLSDDDVESCGNRCNPCPEAAHGSATCETEECSIDCDAGYHLCGSNCLSDSSADSCGDRCNPCTEPDHGTAICDAGRCSFTCDGGYHRCGDVCADDSDVNTCGDRCDPCPSSWSSYSTCEDGECVLHCDDGFHECSGICYRDTNVSTCGDRCEPCPTDPNGDATCDGTACGLDCHEGYLNCDDSCAACPDSEGRAEYGCEVGECVVTACLIGYHCDDTCCGWAEEEIDGSGEATDADLAIDGDGNAHVSYRVADALMYARQTDGSWEVTEVLATGIGWYTAIAVEADGTPHIAYNLTGGSGTSYATIVGDSWTTEEANDEGGVRPRGIVLDSSGEPHVVSYTTRSGTDEAGWVYVSSRIDGTWETHVSYMSGRISPPTIAIDGADILHVTWMEYLDWNLYHLSGPAGGLTSSVASHDARCCGTAYVAVDASDIPHVAFQRRSVGDLAHGWLADDVWSFESLLDDVYTPQDLRIDSTGDLHYAYFVWGPDSVLHYMYALPTADGWEHAGVMREATCRMALGPDDVARFVCTTDEALVFLDNLH